MFWRKKKRMIDVRELQKQGVAGIPQNTGEVVTNPEGFVEMGSSQPTTPSTQAPGSGGNFFNFMDNPASSSPSPVSSDSDLRKISAQLSDLDNKIYKLEQRIELLERKAGV